MKINELIKIRNIKRSIDFAYNKCNLYGSDVDVYSVIRRYKNLNELDEESIDEIYDYIVKGLCF